MSSFEESNRRGRGGLIVADQAGATEHEAGYRLYVFCVYVLRVSALAVRAAESGGGTERGS